MSLAVETTDLTKKYGEKLGCAEVCLRVPRGQIFGFLGPNGAGKSTLVKMLVGLLKPTSGYAEILGRPITDVEARKKIGFLPENFRYHDWLTCGQLLNFHGRLYRMDTAQIRQRVPEVLELVGLESSGDKKIRTFSKGMQQRAGLAVALLADPELLILDEPTSALDPLGRYDVRSLLTDLRDQGKTVFLNSHLLSEVELVCDSVAFINNGRIIRQGKLGEMESGQIVVEMRVGGMNGTLAQALKELSGNLNIREGVITASVTSPEQVAALARAVVQSGTNLYELKQRGSALEETFIQLTRGENDHADND